MDEAAYRNARGGINRLPCVFEKALLVSCAACPLAHRHALAERETLACTDADALARCLTFYRLLRESSTFALKLVDQAERIPHAIEMKLQCGGLRGLQESLEGRVDVIDSGLPRGRPEVQGLLQRALERHDSLAELPYSRIIQGIAAWRGRKRNHTQP
jgi:hypothetical protein